MKKLGFTLAETILAMAVVGVVAAATIPGVIDKQQSKIRGSALSNAITAFESGLATTMMREGVSDVFSTRAWRRLGNSLTAANATEFAGNLSASFPVTYEGAGTAFYGGEIRNVANGRVAIAAVRNFFQTQAFRAKNGAVYFINIPNGRTDNRLDNDGIQVNQGEDLDMNFHTEAAIVNIDTNGRTAPNTIGRDIFFFLLSSEGILYPYGGVEVMNKRSDVNNTWRNRGTAMSCNPATPQQVASFGSNGIGCTARLIENKFEFDY